MTAATDAPPGAELTADEKRLFKDHGWTLPGDDHLKGAPCGHCYGTGRQASLLIRPEWLPLLRELREIGKVRAIYNDRRNTKLGEFYAAVDEICRLTKIAQSRSIPMKVIAGMVGVSSGMMYNYLSGNYGGKGVRKTHPDEAQ